MLPTTLFDKGAQKFWITNNERETKAKGPRLHHRLRRWQAQLKSLDGTGGIGGCHPILLPRAQLAEQAQIGLIFHLEQEINYTLLVSFTGYINLILLQVTMLNLDKCQACLPGLLFLLLHCHTHHMQMMSSSAGEVRYCGLGNLVSRQVNFTYCLCPQC